MFTDAGIRTSGGAGPEVGEASVVASNIGKMLSSRAVEDCDDQTVSSVATGTVEFVFTDAGIRTRDGAGAEFGEAPVVARNIGKMLSSRVVEDCGGIRGKRAARKTLRQSKKA